MVQALAQWRHPVASIEALDVLHWAMCPTLHRHNPMAIDIANDFPAFVCIVDCVVAHNCSQRPCYGHNNIKPSYIIIPIVLMNLFVYYGCLRLMINAVSATVFDGGQAICGKHE